MLDALTKHAEAPARVLMALIFVVSGYGKIGAFAATQQYMEAYGVPGILLIPTIVFELGLGLALLVGLWTRHAALLLAGFCLLTAVVFHRAFDEPLQMVMFLKNLAMAGGLLLLARTGAPDYSLGRWLATRTGA